MSKAEEITCGDYFAEFHSTEDKKQRDISGRTYFLRKVKEMDFKAVDEYLSRCDDLSRRRALEVEDNCRRNALILAVINGNTKMTARLLECIDGGLDINCQDIQGLTALAHAVERNSASMVGGLLFAEADFRLADCCGNTPIILCAKKGHLNAIKELARAVNSVADWQVKGEFDLTAEQWANRMKHEEVEQFIRSQIEELNSSTISTGIPKKDPGLIAEQIIRFRTEELNSSPISTGSQKKIMI